MDPGADADSVRSVGLGGELSTLLSMQIVRAASRPGEDAPDPIAIKAYRHRGPVSHGGSDAGRNEESRIS